MLALFVSDLHLTPQRPAMAGAFIRLLRADARRAQRFYVLGDMFDYWIGDDDLADPFHAEIAAELAGLATSSCQVFFMPGNRDFLLGERFAGAAGFEILPDPSIVALAATPTLLLHGDTLCLDDADYQAFRAKVHAPQWQQQFLRQPIEERRRIALGLRADSESSQKQKSDEIMDVAPRAVEQAFRDCGCTRMIHGHTHRPARHEYRIDGRLCERWVLADWYRAGSYLRCDASGCTAEPWT
ncbi:MAG: UDP-2,3-diacylglucosamine diphosphatase [Betaproteobacteria bacterium]|nr:UDP-2,3-diacylglucosamine diphosphatase [Betaproteobacteria bacterium]